MDYCDSMTTPTLGPIVKRNGIAGEYTYSVTATYPNGWQGQVTFQSSVYGGPIVMVTPAMPGGVFVSSAVLDRIGRTLDPSWVRTFFQPAS